MGVTTIKVTTEVRDRINEIAQERAATANSVLEMLLEEYIWARKLDAARVAMRNASAEDMRTYREETELWDTTSGDGLEGW